MFISLTTRLPRVLRPLVALGGRAVAAAPRAGAAGRGGHPAGRAAGPAPRSRRCCEPRSSGIAVDRPRGHARPRRGRLRGGRRRVRRDARRGRRGASTCRRSPSSTATRGRSCRRSTAPGPSAAWSAGAHLATADLDLRWMALLGRRAPRGPRRAVPPPRAGRRPVPADVGRFRGGRSCSSGRRWCSSTWSTPRPSPGDRPTWTARSTRRRDLVALATFPYLLASGLVRLAGDGLVRRHGAVRVLRAGALGGHPAAWRSSCSRRPGRWRWSASSCSGGGRRRRRPAELLGGCADRRRRHPRPGRAPGPGGRGDRALQPVQLRRARCSAR